MPRRPGVGLLVRLTTGADLQRSMAADQQQHRTAMGYVRQGIECKLWDRQSALSGTIPDMIKLREEKETLTKDCDMLQVIFALVACTMLLQIKSE